ncbi:xaa-Pro aminopeptidase 2-like [Acyrthosiphon pisum]|uniref:Uncharacterized protein n=1 Tax=Acyrthosiphon pisum TaxID=7029 RepID=A0A8R2JMR8_ACYPI|nr:xaa-Pro aminopeptidase 2-like [Acyrthosiphon pisum]
MASIDLASFTFPYNLKLNQIDVIARAPLWDFGYDYKHGTSHGIGVFLKVHEPPVNMYYGQKASDVVLKEGYFISDEPGYYKENHFGVRLETILEVITKNETMGKYLTFEPITLVPFEPKLIDYYMLSPKQVRIYTCKVNLNGRYQKMSHKSFERLDDYALMLRDCFAFFFYYRIISTCDQCIGTNRGGI